MPQNGIISNLDGVRDTKYAVGSHKKIENDPFDRPLVPHDVCYYDEDDPIPNVCHDPGDVLKGHIQIYKFGPFSASDIEVETNNTFGTNETGNKTF